MEEEYEVFNYPVPKLPRVLRKKLGREMAWGTFDGKNIIEIDERLKGKELMEIYFHELEHWMYPEKSENEVIKASRIKTEFFWKHGFRFVDNKSKKWETRGVYQIPLRRCANGYSVLFCRPCVLQMDGYSSGWIFETLFSYEDLHQLVLHLLWSGLANVLVAKVFWVFRTRYNVEYCLGTIRDKFAVLLRQRCGLIAQLLTFCNQPIYGLLESIHRWVFVEKLRGIRIYCRIGRCIEAYKCAVYRAFIIVGYQTRQRIEMPIFES